MTTLEKELGEKLKEIRNSTTDKTAGYHLFGIRHAKEIRNGGANIKEMLKAADLPESFFAEINKGITLSKYVIEKSVLRDLIK